MPSPLLRGLRLTLRHPRPLLWLYAFSLAIAWLTSIGLRSQYATITNSSLAAQRLIAGFDLGVAVDATRRLGEGPSGALSPALLASPLYVLITFLLVPGTLLTYVTDSSLRLGTMLQTGLHLFWTFVRITLWTALIAGPVLGLLGAAQSAWSSFVDSTHTGLNARLLQLVGVILIFLVAALLRLYFDLVEVHAVHRAQYPMPNRKADRRTRKSLRPALDSLLRRFLPSYLTFLLLALLGLGGAFLLSRSALRHLAQPRVWPTFLLAQMSVFLLLFTRLWQRGAETVHVQSLLPLESRSRIFSSANPPPLVSVEPGMSSYGSTFPTPSPVNPVSPTLPGPDSNPLPDTPLMPDPVPNPEPISPSLGFADTGVFQRDVFREKN